MTLRFTWDPNKASQNIISHQISFDEATTIFGDPFAGIQDDPDHSENEQRYLIIGHSNRNRLLMVVLQNRNKIPFGLLAPVQRQMRSEKDMSNSTDKPMRDEYDLFNLRLNPYAKKYAEGVNLVVIEPDLFEIFPDSESVNGALRALLSAFPQDMLRRLRQESQAKTA